MGQTLPGGHPVWISPSVPVQSSPMKTVPSWMLVQRWWQEFWWWVGLQGKPWLSSKNGWILLAHAVCLCLFSCSTFSVVVMPRMEQPLCDHEDRMMEQESLKQKSWNSDIRILCFVKQQTPHLVKLSFMSLFYVWVSALNGGSVILPHGSHLLSVLDSLWLKLNSSSLSPTPPTPTYAYSLYWFVGDLDVIPFFHMLPFLSSIPSISMKLSLSNPWWLFHFEFPWHFKSYCSHWIMYYFILLFWHMEAWFHIYIPKTVSKTSVSQKWRFHPELGMQLVLCNILWLILSCVVNEQVAVTILTWGFLISLDQQNDQNWNQSHTMLILSTTSSVSLLLLPGQSNHDFLQRQWLLPSPYCLACGRYSNCAKQW